MFIRTIETELNKIVYAKVKRAEYPQGVTLMSDAEPRGKLKNLLAGEISRPKTKAEYAALLKSLENQIVEVKAHNEKVQGEYQKALEIINQSFEFDVQAAKLDVENQWRAVRDHRNSLLSECDWTQIPDVPLTDEQRKAWQEYRQALRDIPETFKTPAEVVLPKRPE